MDAFMKDLTYGWRLLWRNPASTAIAIVVVALGIGANTGIFSVVDAVLVRPLPFTEPDRLVAVWEDASHIGFPENTPAPANLVDWKKQNSVFTDIAALASRTYNLTGDADPEKVEGYHQRHADVQSLRKDGHLRQSTGRGGDDHGGDR